MPHRGASPEELRRLGTVLRRAADEVAWLRRRIEAGQDRSPIGRFDTRSLLRLESWLDDNAADVRRRAARLDEGISRRGWLGGVRPPGVVSGRCGPVPVPAGERLFAATPLRCAPVDRRRDERLFATLVTPTGLVVYTRRRKGHKGGTAGGASGGGRRRKGAKGGDGGTGDGRRRPTVEEVLTEKRLPHGDDVEFAFKPRKTWRPGGALDWDRKKRGYVDAKGNVWRKGPSRTPGDPFEWDVQLGPNSRWKKYSRDGKHLNIDLRGRISH